MINKFSWCCKSSSEYGEIYKMKAMVLCMLDWYMARKLAEK
jgi:hypothetical protein